MLYKYNKGLLNKSLFLDDEKIATAHCFYEIYNTLEKLFGNDKRTYLKFFIVQK